MIAQSLVAGEGKGSFPIFDFPFGRFSPTMDSVSSKIHPDVKQN